MMKACWNAFLTQFIPAAMVAITLCVSPVWADNQDPPLTTVYAVGTSNIRGSDLSASRNQAIAGSLVSAVTDVLTDILPPDTVVGHFQMISEQILSSTDQFIRDYKMLTESRSARKHRVIVLATVSVDRLKKVLNESGIYLGQKNYPSILFFIAEKQINDMNFQFWWDGRKTSQTGTAGEAISRTTSTKGFEVVSPDGTAIGGAYSPQLSIPEAVSLGRQLQADIVVLGRALAEEAAQGAGSALKSYRGSIAAQAYRVQDGEEVGNVRHSSMATGADPLTGGNGALEKASILAGEELSTQIVKTWFARGAGASKIEILIEGLSGNIANFVKFRGALSTMSGVGNVQRKEMQSNTATLLLDYQGNVGALAEALKRKNFGNFNLKITEPEGNTLRLQLVNPN